jgi:hypothetical protein
MKGKNMQLKEFTNLLLDMQEMEMPISDTTKGKQVQQTFRNNLTSKLLEALYKDCEQSFLGETDIIPYLIKGGVILEVPNASVADSLGENDLGSGALSIELNVTIKNLDTDAQELADDYAFKLEQATLNSEACCRATAYLVGQQDAKGVFYIAGTKCYRYDSANNKYYLLTTSGSKQAEVDIEETTKATVDETQEVSFHQKTEEDINDENTQVLRARYKNYDLSVVGITKPIDNYTFLATSKIAEAKDGAKIFVIYLMENGQYTEFKFGMGTNGKDYYYDRATDEYKVLS